MTKKQLCHVCKKEVLSNLVHNDCKEKTNLDGVFVIAKYSKFIENYLGDIKYEFYFAMIPDLAEIVNTSLEKNRLFQILKTPSIITFVPLHPLRKNWRGFNQAEKIAQRIGGHFSIPCVKLLERNRKTKSQVGLHRGERLQNLNSAFSLNHIRNQSLNLGRPVIIIDDVMTSGATLEECAKILKTNGYERVHGLVFARG